MLYATPSLFTSTYLYIYSLSLSFLLLRLSGLLTHLCPVTNIVSSIGESVALGIPHGHFSVYDSRMKPWIIQGADWLYGAKLQLVVRLVGELQSALTIDDATTASLFVVAKSPGVACLGLEDVIEFGRGSILEDLDRHVHQMYIETLTSLACAKSPVSLCSSDAIVGSQHTVSRFHSAGYIHEYGVCMLQS